MWVNPERLGRDEEAGFVAHGDPASGGWAVGLGAKRKLTFVSGTTRTRTRVTLPFKVWSMVNVSWTGGNVTVAVNGGTTTKIAPRPASPRRTTAAWSSGGKAARRVQARVQGPDGRGRAVRQGPHGNGRA
jgi:hypothetical protein